MVTRAERRKLITYTVISSLVLLGVLFFFVIPNKKRLEKINDNLDTLDDIIKDFDEH